MIPIHVSVMPEEVMKYLVPSRPDALIVDGTLGEGGHALRFLESYPECRVIGIDADTNSGNLERAFDEKCDIKR